jgi:predicted nucleotidyltransferase
MQLNEDLFLQSIIAQLKQPGVMGIGVVGSYVRGESKKYSDVDIDIFVEKLPADTYTLRFMDARFPPFLWHGPW